MDSDNKRCCNTCRFNRLNECDTLTQNKEYQSIEDDKPFHHNRYKFMDEFICEKYLSRYIEYPIEVSKIVRNTDIISLREKEIGRFVSIRPCGEEYEGKTYLGLFLGDLPVDFYILHNDETKELKVQFVTNPGIFVFDLNRIIYGRESWWRFIESENDLKSITDKDIENVWYMKALKALTQEKQEG